MTKRNKSIIIAGLVIVLLIVGGFFIYSFTREEPEDEVIEYTPEGEVPQVVEDPEIVDSGSTTDNATSDDTTSTVDNSDYSNTLKPTTEMEAVINENKDNLNNEEVVSQIAPSYPTDLIPLYKASQVADSSDITTDNGNPGWICQYGSDAYVDDIATFYKNLLSSTTGYSDETTADTTQVVGTIDNCYVQVTISPNNPERTGMNSQSDVDIFIERKNS